MEMGRKDTMTDAHTIQLPGDTNVEHDETIRQKRNREKDT